MAECIDPRQFIGVLLAFSAIYLAVTAGVMAWRERRRERPYFPRLPFGLVCPGPQNPAETTFSMNCSDEKDWYAVYWSGAELPTEEDLRRVLRDIIDNDKDEPK